MTSEADEEPRGGTKYPSLTRLMREKGWTGWGYWFLSTPLKPEEPSGRTLVANPNQPKHALLFFFVFFTSSHTVSSATCLLTLQICNRTKFEREQEHFSLGHDWSWLMEIEALFVRWQTNYALTEVNKLCLLVLRGIVEEIDQLFAQIFFQPHI